jgi:hypothetical protein
MAKLWRVQNAPILHLVDLDAARGDASDNRRVIREICKALDIPAGRVAVDDHGLRGRRDIVQAQCPRSAVCRAPHQRKHRLGQHLIGRPAHQRRRDIVSEREHEDDRRAGEDTWHDEGKLDATPRGRPRRAPGDAGRGHLLLARSGQPGAAGCGAERDQRRVTAGRCRTSLPPRRQDPRARRLLHADHGPGLDRHPGHALWHRRLRRPRSDRRRLRAVWPAGAHRRRGGWQDRGGRGEIGRRNGSATRERRFLVRGTRRNGSGRFDFRRPGFRTRCGDRQRTDKRPEHGGVGFHCYAPCWLHPGQPTYSYHWITKLVSL